MVNLKKRRPNPFRGTLLEGGARGDACASALGGAGGDVRARALPLALLGHGGDAGDKAPSAARDGVPRAADGGAALAGLNRI